MQLTPDIPVIKIPASRLDPAGITRAAERAKQYPYEQFDTVIVKVMPQARRITFHGSTYEAADYAPPTHPDGVPGIFLFMRPDLPKEAYDAAVSTQAALRLLQRVETGHAVDEYRVHPTDDAKAALAALQALLLEVAP